MVDNFNELYRSDTHMPSKEPLDFPWLEPAKGKTLPVRFFGGDPFMAFYPGKTRAHEAHQDGLYLKWLPRPTYRDLPSFEKRRLTERGFLRLCLNVNSTYQSDYPLVRYRDGVRETSRERIPDLRVIREYLDPKRKKGDVYFNTMELDFKTIEERILASQRGITKEVMFFDELNKPDPAFYDKKKR